MSAGTLAPVDAGAPERLRRRLLGPVATAVHRVAIGVAARTLRRSRALPAPAGDRTRVRFLLEHAYGMGGTIRTTLGVAGSLAERHDVEVVSLFRTRERAFLGIPAGVAVTTLDDRRRTAGRGRLQR